MSRINLESDKGSTEVATSAALDNSLCSDELTDEFSADKSPLADEMSLAVEDETVATAEENADDVSIADCACEVSATASTDALADAMDETEGEASSVESCKLLVDEDCAASIVAG
ncbi:hypothetical protein [Cellvibrio fibrivorans]|uniref:Uncharacterized protein n=1 Tax=Cellvibrio fibrivorans TaxID=126350 RepID=A0ABU1UWV9_9GAMM|nr:hypothetical protein [Cellvibrio fibrivorans]MDR7089672.1 hypothetical protein [Cellvibrio fibrivorans]